MITAQLVVPSVPLDLFSGEDREFSNGRAGYEIIEKDNSLVFDVYAKDPVALRAVLTSITKTLTIYEKMQGLNNESRTN